MASPRRCGCHASVSSWVTVRRVTVSTGRYVGVSSSHIVGAYRRCSAERRAACAAPQYIREFLASVLIRRSSYRSSLYTIDGEFIMTSAQTSNFQAQRGGPHLKSGRLDHLTCGGLCCVLVLFVVSVAYRRTHVSGCPRGLSSGGGELRVDAGRSSATPIPPGYWCGAASRSVGIRTT